MTHVVFALQHLPLQWKGRTYLVRHHIYVGFVSVPIRASVTTRLKLIFMPLGGDTGLLNCREDLDLDLNIEYNKDYRVFIKGLVSEQASLISQQKDNFICLYIQYIIEYKLCHNGTSGSCAGRVKQHIHVFLFLSIKNQETNENAGHCHNMRDAQWMLDRG